MCNYLDIMVRETTRNFLISAKKILNKIFVKLLTREKSLAIIKMYPTPRGGGIGNSTGRIAVWMHLKTEKSC
jgi:hypothetical protein